MRKPAWLGAAWSTFLKSKGFSLNRYWGRRGVVVYRLNQLEVVLRKPDSGSTGTELFDVSMGDGYSYSISFPGVKTMRDLELLMKFMENPDERSA